MAVPRDRKTQRPGVCASAWCGNAPAPESRHCHKCRSRHFKHKFPMKYAFNLLRCGAKRRKIAFSLTFAQYEELWSRHPVAWAEKRANMLSSNAPQGRTNAKTWEVDRVREWDGYHYHNLQVIEKCLNVAKSNTYRSGKVQWQFLGDAVAVVQVNSGGYVSPF